MCVKYAYAELVSEPNLPQVHKCFYQILRAAKNIKSNVYTPQLASEYERNLGKLILDKNKMLEELKENQHGNASDIQKLEQEIETLRSLYENYNLGMNYFRRARGGRSGLRE